MGRRLRAIRSPSLFAPSAPGALSGGPSPPGGSLTGTVSPNFPSPGWDGTGTGTCSPPHWTPRAMWALCGTPSGWRRETANRRSLAPSSLPFTTAASPSPPGSERGSPTRFSPTASTACPSRTPPAWWGAAPSIRAGKRSRNTAPTNTARSATGTSSAAASPAWRKNYPICKAWGWRPSTSAPSLKPRRTTVTAPPTMKK